MDNEQIEEFYRAQIHKLSGSQRLVRAIAMLESLMKMKKYHYQKKFPEYTDRQIQLEVARSLYRNDPVIQELLNKIDV